MSVEAWKYIAASDNAYHRYDAQYVSLLHMYCFMYIPPRTNAGFVLQWIIQMFLPFTGRYVSSGCLM